VTGHTEPATLERGVFVVSIDTELAWGEAHRPDAGERNFDSERAVISGLLGLFARYEISATWAVVGHLLLDRCDAVDGRPHPEVVRPSYSWLSGDWFDVDPCSTLDTAPMYYGSDIVESIRACPVPQEIGCHSFSHLIAGDPECGAAAFGSDLAACQSLAADHGLTMRSFVFPRNSIGYVDQLAAHGFVCYRGSPGAPGGRWHRLADRLRPLTSSAVKPSRHPTGVWNVPQTYLYAPAERASRLPITVWTRRPRARLRLAAEQAGIFHLWFHPHNIAANPQRALGGLEILFGEAARLRDTGRLEVLTMGGLADRLGSPA
jgi:hypothetical protein